MGGQTRHCPDNQNSQSTQSCGFYETFLFSKLFSWAPNTVTQHLYLLSNGQPCPAFNALHQRQLLHADARALTTSIQEKRPPQTLCHRVQWRLPGNSRTSMRTSVNLTHKASTRALTAARSRCVLHVCVTEACVIAAVLMLIPYSNEGDDV